MKIINYQMNLILIAKYENGPRTGYKRFLIRRLKRFPETTITLNIVHFNVINGSENYW